MSFELGTQSDSDVGSGLIKDTSTAAFGKDVIEASQNCLVLVDFWAPWCGPCKQLTPVLESIVKSYKGKVKLVKINVDKNQSIAAQLRVQSLPTVYAFRDGQLLDGFMGGQPESAIREFIDRSLGPDVQAEMEQALARASEALQADDLQSAAGIYASILQSEAQNPDALAGLASCYLKSGDNERASQTIALVPPDKKNIPSVASVIATMELAEKAPATKSFAPLEARLKANPLDHEARLELAIAAAAAGNKERAIDELIDLFRRERTWNDEAARKQLIQFFEAWGPKDPHTLDGRRRLSSLMFT